MCKAPFCRECVREQSRGVQQGHLTEIVLQLQQRPVQRPCGRPRQSRAASVANVLQRPNISCT